MRKFSFILYGALAMTVPDTTSGQDFEEDLIPTSGGNLKIAFIGHGTLMLTYGGKTIHVDPVDAYADYDKIPRTDLILITHEHGDHLDPAAVAKIAGPQTEIILTERGLEKLKHGAVMRNGDTEELLGIKIEAVPAYNLVHKRAGGDPFHPKGIGNGYIITFADKRIYIAGDTENTPEMKSLKNIDVAFLPMNLPYTMSPEMAADAALAFKPKILYPYHFGNTDTSKLTTLLKGEQGIEVRIRKLQ